jgi:hypothetical protein
MGESGAEDKPKRRRWERRDLQWEGKFEYFDHTRYSRYMVNRVEQAEVSTGWWLCAGRVEVLIAFGAFSGISLWLYWARIGSLLHQAEDSHS